MRILRLLVTSLLVLTIVGSVSFLVLREVLLFVATSQVRSSVTVVRRSTNLIPGTPASECQSATTLQGGGSLMNVFAVQLAFQNDQEYRWELICDSPLREPKLLAQFTLPPLVKKVPGSSGLLWREPYSTFSIDVWGRKRSFILKDRELTVTNGLVAEASIEQPITACSGFGYHCCSIDAESGTGGQVSEVRDCPLSCFAQCTSRPVILSFVSQPYADTATRILPISVGDSVAFTYMVDAGTAKSASITLQFGDGEVFQSRDLQSTATHTYTCSTASCTYQAILTVVDDQGSSAAVSRISRIDVVVTGQ